MGILAGRASRLAEVVPRAHAQNVVGAAGRCAPDASSSSEVSIAARAPYEGGASSVPRADRNEGGPPDLPPDGHHLVEFAKLWCPMVLATWNSRSLLGGSGARPPGCPPSTLSWIDCWASATRYALRKFAALLLTFPSCRAPTDTSVRLGSSGMRRPALGGEALLWRSERVSLRGQSMCARRRSGEGASCRWISSLRRQCSVSSRSMWTPAGTGASFAMLY